MRDDHQINILNNMGMVVMERQTDGNFRLIGDSPEWFRLFFMEEESLQPEQSPFLENFLTDAENFWASESGGQLRSDPWLENDLTSGYEYAFEAIAVAADGRKILLLETVSCSHYKEKQYIIQKGRELNLAYHRLAKIESELRKAKNAAEAANRAKSEFLSNMGHEIRTPMNAILGFTYLMFQTEITSSQKEFLDNAYESAQTLMKLLNDILNYSELESERHCIEETVFSIEETFQNLSDTMNLKAEEKGLCIRYSVSEKMPYTLLGDPMKLTQILSNLVENAIKFTEKGDIVLSAEQVSCSEDRVKIRFSVADNGIGITSEKLPIIFDAFTQADGSITRKFGGTGLGLAICKRLTEMMGGEISVESEAGKGSIFSFTAEFGIVSPEDSFSFEPYDKNSCNITPEAEPEVEVMPESAHNIDITKLILCLTELDSMLQTGDFESVAFMKQIRKDLTGVIPKDKIANLETYVRNYEFEKAEKIAKDIITLLGG